MVTAINALNNFYKCLREKLSIRKNTDILVVGFINCLVLYLNKHVNVTLHLVASRKVSLKVETNINVMNFEQNLKKIVKYL